MRNEINLRTIFRKKDIIKFRAQYKPGDKIIVTEKINEDGQIRKVTRLYTVARAFPSFLSCVNKHGMRVSLNYFDLEKQKILKAMEK